MNGWMTRAFLALSVALVACDPVNSDARSALGGEAPGIRPGQFHRAGQPCLVCHDGQIGDPSAFSVAGTIYVNPDCATAANQTMVALTDSANTMYPATANSAGNFFITPGQWSPVFPIKHVQIVGPTGVTSTMQSEVGRDGACSSCHVKGPAGPASPGCVALSNFDGGLLP